MVLVGSAATAFSPSSQKSPCLVLEEGVAFFVSAISFVVSFAIVVIRLSKSLSACWVSSEPPFTPHLVRALLMSRGNMRRKHIMAGDVLLNLIKWLGEAFYFFTRGIGHAQLKKLLVRA